LFLIYTKGCKIPNLNPYDPLIKAHLNKGEVLKCAVQEDRVYSANGTIFINWEVVKISTGKEIKKNVSLIQYETKSNIKLFLF
jgi:hypothetical protein